MTQHPVTPQEAREALPIVPLWEVVNPEGASVALEPKQAMAWARVTGTYKATLEGVLGLEESGWRVVPTGSVWLELESLKAALADEVAANMAFREKGGALPNEDMPTFCGRLIRERDAALAQQSPSAHGGEDAKDAARWRKCLRMPKAWWLAAMEEAGLKGGRSLDAAIDAAIAAASPAPGAGQ